MKFIAFGVQAQHNYMYVDNNAAPFPHEFYSVTLNKIDCRAGKVVVVVKNVRAHGDAALDSSS